MKKIFLLLAAVGMIFTACEPANRLDEDNNGNNGNNTEQPGGGDQGEEPIFITDNESDIVVEAKGGTVVVTVSTNLEYSVVIPEEAQSWLSVADTRAIRMEKLTFTIAKNEADAERSAVIKLLGSDNAELQSLSFVQKGASAEEEIPADKTQAIKFQDENTKLLCTLHWDENEDGELSYEEAAAVTDLGTAFKGSSILAFTELKYFTSLEKIADSAFDGCVSLVKITLPEQITTIGTSAFNGCTNLKKIAIPNAVTEIGGNAFNGCSSLTSATIGNGVTSIGGSAFSSCTSLTSVDISDLSAWCKISFGNSAANPLSNGAKLYLNGSELTDITIPSDITEIKAYAFQGCTSLTSITIPDSVTSIEYRAFYNCTALTSVTIPDSVTSIGGYAFWNCSSLTSVTIPDSVTSIGGYAFWYCSSLTSVTIPDSVTSIEDYAFRNCTSLKSVTIPDSVTSIGSEAFYGCKSLTSVTIGNGVTSIGSNAFYGCTGELIINSKIIETDYNLENYPSYNYLGSGNWLYGSNFTKLIIGNNITSIGDYAFRNCRSLTSITIPDSVTSIGEDAFSYCTSLTSVDISDLSAWCKISFGNSVANPLSNGAKLYLNGSELTDITIPSDITEIKAYAFQGCTSLTSITIPDSVTSIEYRAFYNCTALTSATIPDSVTSIGEYAFSGCASLTTITIPDSVTSIGYGAFEDCTSLTSVTIGNSVTLIGVEAFQDCTSLKEVYCKPTTPPTGNSYMFHGHASGLKIYVPRNSVETYKSASGWRYYASDIEGYDF